jgi:hypothetical protein
MESCNLVRLRYPPTRALMSGMPDERHFVGARGRDGDVVTVENLPDYPAIEQVNKALWRAGRTRGAAVLVGAGFSRNAERIHEGAPMPPDWKTLTKALQTRLGYPTDEHKEPLRIAEEFIASLGRSALDSLIMELVPDDQWLPGRLHKALVALDWVWNARPLLYQLR